MLDLSQRLTAALSDRYRIEREIGRGGMATVFLAEDLKHHRRVAIKVFDPGIAAAIGAERFLREIETVARLTHPHILPLHDSGAAGGLLFYVMPYIEGESLRHRMSREKQLPLDDALRITREVADALDYAHSHGVVHRDIKPENILLESGHAVVADFGIARAIAAGGADTQEVTQAAGPRTTLGSVVGTPTYMSPEQASGSRDIDGRADLYSLGCVLYEMLAGTPPFTGPTLESLSLQHRSVTPHPVTELRPAVPATVAAALQRALAKAPADRFNATAQFAAALGPGESGTIAAPPPSAKSGHGAALLGLAALVLVAVIGGALVLRGQRAKPALPGHQRSEVAVLPLQNLSAGGPHAYFAGGLHEELLTQLAKVASLKVISRTSVMGYANTTKPLKQIAAELGVGSIVEGSVQVEGNRLRVNVQLIDAATDEHLWAEHYDRTLDDAFAIQSDVAQQIVKAVGATLAAGERQAIAAAPTANAEAYRLYLQGEDFRHRPGGLKVNLESAQLFYERAVALDPDFALAHAELSVIHQSMAWFAYDESPERAKRMRTEAELALRLAPGLPQAHIAMSRALTAALEFPRAVVECRIALSALPNDAELWAEYGYSQRLLGNWSAVDSAYQQASELDPRNADTQYDLGGRTLTFTHRFQDAERAFDRALALAPNLEVAALYNGICRVGRSGDLAALQHALDVAPSDADVGEGRRLLPYRAYLLFLERKPDSLLTILRAATDRRYTGSPYLFQPDLYAAWAQRMRGDQPAAQRAFAAALAELAKDPHWDSSDPGDWDMHALRGLALAGLGRKAEARAQAEWLRRSTRDRHNILGEIYMAEERAHILAEVGDSAAALDEIERLLSQPSWLTAPLLRVDPRWDALRDQPRFKALLVKYANPELPAPANQP